MKVMIMAGGTGGHIFPAAAVAEVLEQQGSHVQWLGSERGMEGELVPKMGYQFCALPVTAWQGGKLRKVLAPINMVRAVIECFKVFSKEKPDVVIGFGGYASAPGGVIAVMKRIPLILHEQNGVPGLTNLILAKFADKVLQAFPKTFRQDYLLVGNPVRQNLCELQSPEERGVGKSRQLKVLVLGGSQGAQAINELVPEAIKLLPSAKHIEVWHQAGKGKSESVQASYGQYKLEATVVEFISDMAAAFKWADIVISRSGASTVSELASVGLGSLLIPYPWHKDRQQYRNAQWLVDQDAAKVLEQFDLDANQLAEEIKKMDDDRQQLLNMAENAWKAGIRNSAKQIAQVVNESVKSKTT